MHLAEKEFKPTGLESGACAFKYALEIYVDSGLSPYGRQQTQLTVNVDIRSINMCSERDLFPHSGQVGSHGHAEREVGLIGGKEAF